MIYLKRKKKRKEKKRKYIYVQRVCSDFCPTTITISRIFFHLIPRRNPDPSLLINTRLILQVRERNFGGIEDVEEEWAGDERDRRSLPPHPLLAFLEPIKFLFHVPYILQLERCLPKKPLYLFVYNNYIYTYIYTHIYMYIYIIKAREIAFRPRVCVCEPAKAQLLSSSSLSPLHVQNLASHSLTLAPSRVIYTFSDSSSSCSSSSS